MILVSATPSTFHVVTSPSAPPEIKTVPASLANMQFTLPLWLGILLETVLPFQAIISPDKWPVKTMLPQYAYVSTVSAGY